MQAESVARQTLTPEPVARSCTRMLPGAIPGATVYHHVLPGGDAVLADVRAKSGGGERLLSPPDARVALDRDYIFACCGALLQHFAPEAVTALMRASAGL